MKKYINGSYRDLTDEDIKQLASLPKISSDPLAERLMKIEAVLDRVRQLLRLD